MKVWRWQCHTHQLALLTMQTGEEPPVECSGLAELVYPDDGPCWFHGSPIYTIYADSGRVSQSFRHSLTRSEPPPDLLAGGALSGKAGKGTPPLPATRLST